MIPKQLDHIDHTPDRQQLTINIICPEFQSPANMGAIFRLADAFDIEGLYFTNAPNLNSNRFKKTARATYKTVSYTSVDKVGLLHRFHESGYTSIALELTDQSIPIKDLTINTNKKYVIIIGHENTGIPLDILNLTMHHCHIPMYGQNSSMNIAQATAIALYELSSYKGSL